MKTTPTLFKDGFPVAQPFASAIILYDSGEWFCWGERLATDELAKRTGVPLVELLRWEAETAMHDARWIHIYQQYQHNGGVDE